MHKINLRKIFHIKLLHEKEALGSSQRDFYIGNISYGSERQVYYVKQQYCSGALTDQTKSSSKRVGNSEA